MSGHIAIPFRAQLLEHAKGAWGCGMTEARDLTPFHLDFRCCPSQQVIQTARSKLDRTTFDHVWLFEIWLSPYVPANDHRHPPALQAILHPAFAHIYPPRSSAVFRMLTGESPVVKMTHSKKLVWLTLGGGVADGKRALILATECRPSDASKLAQGIRFRILNPGPPKPVSRHRRWILCAPCLSCYFHLPPASASQIQGLHTDGAHSLPPSDPPRRPLSGRVGLLDPLRHLWKG